VYDANNEPEYGIKATEAYIKPVSLSSLSYNNNSVVPEHPHIAVYRPEEAGDALDELTGVFNAVEIDLSGDHVRNAYEQDLLNRIHTALESKCVEFHVQVAIEANEEYWRGCGELFGMGTGIQQESGTGHWFYPHGVFRTGVPAQYVGLAGGVSNRIRPSTRIGKISLDEPNPCCVDGRSTGSEISECTLPDNLDDVDVKWGQVQEGYSTYLDFAVYLDRRETAVVETVKTLMTGYRPGYERGVWFGQSAFGEYLETSVAWSQRNERSRLLLWSKQSSFKLRRVWIRVQDELPPVNPYYNGGANTTDFPTPAPTVAPEAGTSAASTNAPTPVPMTNTNDVSATETLSLPSGGTQHANTSADSSSGPDSSDTGNTTNMSVERDSSTVERDAFAVATGILLVCVLLAIVGFILFRRRQLRRAQEEVAAMQRTQDEDYTGSSGRSTSVLDRRRGDITMQQVNYSALPNSPGANVRSNVEYGDLALRPAGDRNSLPSAQAPHLVSYNVIPPNIQQREKAYNESSFSNL